MLILFQLLALFLLPCVVLGTENWFQIIPTLFPRQPKLEKYFSYYHWSILQFWLPPQKTTHFWNVVITARTVNFMNFCFILIMHDVKVFGRSSFRYSILKGSFSSEIFKVGFSEVSAVKVNRGLLNITEEKLLLSSNVLSLILNKTKTNLKKGTQKLMFGKRSFCKILKKS